MSSFVCGLIFQLLPNCLMIRAPELGLYGIVVNVPCKLLRCDGHWFVHEFGYIVALVVVLVEVWSLLREYKGLMCLSALVEVGYVESCVSSVVASASEEYPSSVAGPGVVAFHIVAVYLLHIA